MPSRPTTIGLVFGGRSGEHDVDPIGCHCPYGLTSGSNQARYRVVPVYIDREGRWWMAPSPRLF